jgi:hypothetical protein
VGGLLVQVMMADPTFPPNAPAPVLVSASTNGQPTPGVKFQASYFFPAGVEQCTGITDTSGNGQCSVLVAVAPDGTRVNVAVQAVDPVGGRVLVTTTFVIQRV